MKKKTKKIIFGSLGLIGVSAIIPACVLSCSSNAKNSTQTTKNQIEQAVVSQIYTDQLIKKINLPQKTGWKYQVSSNNSMILVSVTKHGINIMNRAKDLKKFKLKIVYTNEANPKEFIVVYKTVQIVNPPKLSSSSISNILKTLPSTIYAGEKLTIKLPQQEGWTYSIVSNNKNLIVNSTTNNLQFYADKYATKTAEIQLTYTYIADNFDQITLKKDISILSTPELSTAIKTKIQQALDCNLYIGQNTTINLPSLQGWTYTVASNETTVQAETTNNGITLLASATTYKNVLISLTYTSQEDFQKQIKISQIVNVFAKPTLTTQTQNEILNSLPTTVYTQQNLQINLPNLNQWILNARSSNSNVKVSVINQAIKILVTKNATWSTQIQLTYAFSNYLSDRVVLTKRITVLPEPEINKATQAAINSAFTLKSMYAGSTKTAQIPYLANWKFIANTNNKNVSSIVQGTTIEFIASANATGEFTVKLLYTSLLDPSDQITIALTQQVKILTIPKMNAWVKNKILECISISKTTAGNGASFYPHNYKNWNFFTAVSSNSNTSVYYVSELGTIYFQTNLAANKLTQLTLIYQNTQDPSDYVSITKTIFIKNVPNSQLKNKATAKNVNVLGPYLNPQ